MPKLTNTPRATITTAAAPLPPIVLTIRETCGAIKACRSTVYELLAAKQLDAVKRGAKTLVTVASIERHLAGLPPMQGL